MTHIPIHVVQTPRSAPLKKSTTWAAGYDISACFPEDSLGKITLDPGWRACIPTGIFFQMPMNVEAQIRPRSGLALKHGVTVLNSPGTIDPDYTGEIKVILINLGQDPFVIHHHDRIAQVVFKPILDVTLTHLSELPHEGDLEAPPSSVPGVRGSGGFGSTGV